MFATVKKIMKKKKERKNKETKELGLPSPVSEMS